MTGTWASGFATGDIITAAEYRKSVGSIFDTTLGGSAATIDVTGIVATYAHLMITVYARSDAATNVVGSLLRFNGDAGANYDYQYHLAQAATLTGNETFAATSLQMGDITASTAGANLFGTQEIFIPHYAGSANNKMANSISATKTGINTTNILVNRFAGAWRSNAAINRITFLPGSGNFVAGTRITIHALGA